MDIILPADFAAAWLAILSLFALFVQAVANRPSWSPTAKRAVAVVIAVLLGTIYMIASGAIEGLPLSVVDAFVRWIMTIAGVFVASQAVYGFFKPTLDKVEAATSPPSAPVEPIDEP